MQKTTQGDLSKKLLKYGALSAAVMGLADANGQIIYTDVDPDVTISEGQSFSIDFDNNSLNDFIVGNYAAGAGFSPVDSMGSIGGLNGFVGISASFAYPSNLAADVTVDSNSPNVVGSFGTLIYGNSSSGFCNYSSLWCDGVVDGYAGVLINIAGNTHYGWARLDVAADGSTVVIKDFAYNLTPGEAITTGQQTLSVDEFSPIDFSYLVDSNNVLTMSSNEALGNLKVYNVVGKEVMASSLSTRNEQVDVSALSTGVYLAKVSIGSQSKTFKFVKR